MFYAVFPRTAFYAAKYWKIKKVFLWPTNSLYFVCYIVLLQFVRSRFSSYMILNEFILKFIQAKWPNHCKMLQWIMTVYTESSVSRRTWRSWQTHSFVHFIANVRNICCYKFLYTSNYILVSGKIMRPNINP